MTKSYNDRTRILREQDYASFRYGGEEMERRKAERERWQNRRAKNEIRSALLDGRRV